MSDDAKAKAAARAARMAAKASAEEDEPVAVRSFTDARDGAGAKAYSHKTGTVGPGAVHSGPKKSGGKAAASDDDLFAEIDAAVAEAEKSGPRSPTPEREERE